MLPVKAFRSLVDDLRFHPCWDYGRDFDSERRHLLSQDFRHVQNSCLGALCIPPHFSSCKRQTLRLAKTEFMSNIVMLFRFCNFSYVGPGTAAGKSLEMPL